MSTICDLDPKACESRDGTQVCVGHALTLSPFIDDCDLLVSPNESYGMNYLMKLLSSDVPSMVSSFETVWAENIEAHATVICILKTNMKTYIWYYNPWGYVGDRDYCTRRRREYKSKEENQGRMREIKADVEKKTKSVVSRERGPHLIHEYITYCLEMAKRKFRENGVHGDFVVDDAISDWIMGAIGNLNGALKDRSADHIMGALEAFRKSFGAYNNHVTIIHPFVSMSHIGPQHLFPNERITSFEKHFEKNSVTGACLTWSDIYAKRAKSLLEGRTLSHGEIMKIISRDLRENELVGESSARDLLGKLRFSRSNESIKQLLLGIFDSIPEEYELPPIGNGHSLPYHKSVIHAFDKFIQDDNPAEDIGYHRELSNTFLLKIVDIGEPIHKDIDIENLVNKIVFENRNSRIIVNLVMLLIMCKHSDYFRSVSARGG